MAQPAIITPKTWVKYYYNPVVHMKMGNLGDPTLVKEDTATMHMWCSWYTKGWIVQSYSKLGDHWSAPLVVFKPDSTTGWENEVSHPMVLWLQGVYHMWYVGRANGRSCIGYATSPNGRIWKRMSPKPVLVPDLSWERNLLTSPCVIWNDKDKKYQMWYSAGEPDAIGYATSNDGLIWEKYPANPVFKSDTTQSWEKTRVCDCQVVLYQGWYHMFYTGYEGDLSQIGLARSKNGLDGWERMNNNPIITRGKDGWDKDGAWHPYGFIHGTQWAIWYSGKHNGKCQVGIGLHDGLSIFNR